MMLSRTIHAIARRKNSGNIFIKKWNFFFKIRAIMQIIDQAELFVQTDFCKTNYKKS